MNFHNEAVFQGRYRLLSRDPETNELIDSGWSDNKIIKSAAAAALINETGLGELPVFQLGFSATDQFDSFENVIALTHTTSEEDLNTFGFVDDDETKGYRITGGGSYKFTPNTNVRGGKVNQVGIKDFSIAQIVNAKGVPVLYPVNPGVEIEIQYHLTMTVKAELKASLPIRDQNDIVLETINTKINMAVNQTEFNASGHRWWKLLSGNRKVIGFETVNGDINDPVVLKNMDAGPNIWTDVVRGTANLAPGNWSTRGLLPHAVIETSFIRFGINVGIPGLYCSVIFLTPFKLPARYLHELGYTVTYLSTGL